MSLVIPVVCFLLLDFLVLTVFGLFSLVLIMICPVLSLADSIADSCY